MADSSSLPGSHYWPALPYPFWMWFQQVEAFRASGQTAIINLAAVTESVTALDARVTTLEAASGVGTLTGPQSVRVDGALATGATVRLRGDVSAPGASFYYGTNPAGTKGWYTHAVSTLADVDLTGLVADDVLRWSGTAWVRQPASDFIVTLFDDANAGAVLTTLGVSAFVQTIFDDANAAAVLATIGAQPLDSTLTGLSGASPALPALTEYADDAAAAAGGLAVGKLYRTGSIIKIRVA